LRYELEVQCLWNWGCRRRSLVYLKENDIDYTKRKVRITTTKTGQPYWVGVDTETINLLKRYLKVRPKSRDHWVFTNDNGERLNEQSVSKEIQHAREMLKEKGFDVKSTPHSFRRSSVLGMVQQNLQPTAIMRLHGMRSVKMIDVYAKDLDIDDIIEVQRDRENWYKKIEAKKNEK
jgi:integrase